MCTFLLPHALTCTKWLHVGRQQKPEGVDLLIATGRYLYERAQYKEAEPLIQRALIIVEEQLGSSVILCSFVVGEMRCGQFMRHSS
jgi:hypothetical protein